MGKILIGADFVPTKSNENLFVSGDADSLLGGELVELLGNAEYRVFNLEMPFTNQYHPLKKCGPALIGVPDALNLYKKIHIDLFTLANNHIMDQSEDGLNDTIDMLNRNKIHYLGAGKNLIEAQKPFIYSSSNGNEFGFYACSEHEFSIADESTPGANPFDPLDSFDHIRALSKECDYVIVLYHGGKEFYQYTSPLNQRICRKFIECGANLVVTQHSHTVGCHEKFRDGLIVYGQGNFLFDGGNTVYWQTGLLLSIDTNSFSCEFIPVVKDKEKVRLANDRQKKEILSDFINRSEKIKYPCFLRNSYQMFSMNMIENYLLSFHGTGKGSYVFRLLNKISGHRFQHLYLHKKYKTSQCLAIRNYIECEAHRELVLEGIKHFFDS